MRELRVEATRNSGGNWTLGEKWKMRKNNKVLLKEYATVVKAGKSVGL